MEAGLALGVTVGTGKAVTVISAFAVQPIASVPVTSQVVVLFTVKVGAAVMFTVPPGHTAATLAVAVITGGG